MVAEAPLTRRLAMTRVLGIRLKNLQHIVQKFWERESMVYVSVAGRAVIRACKHDAPTFGNSDSEADVR